MKEKGIEVGSGIPKKKYDSKEVYELIHIANCFPELRGEKKVFIITFVPNKIYCLAGYWIEAVSPGKFESILYQKTKRKINEYKNTKKEVDEFIKGINLEYKSIKKEINDFFRN